jgi:hypothetical protein
LKEIETNKTQDEKAITDKIAKKKAESEKKAKEEADKLSELKANNAELSCTNAVLSNSINLKKGLYKASYSYVGERNFAFWVKDENGNNIELVANTIGSKDGSKALSIRNDGKYFIDIQIESSWTVKLEKQ